MKNYKEILSDLFEKTAKQRSEKTSAGTKFRLAGLVADINEVSDALQQEVLQRVKQEAVLDADVDINYAEISEQMMEQGLQTADDDLQEQTMQVNDALHNLGDVLGQIDAQLGRHHKDEEYERLYEQEKRRYLSSGTPRRVRQTFDDWLYNVCYGTPSLEDVNDYVTEKLVHMFEKGVFNTKVEHIQRATRYPGEFDFSLLDDDHKLKKTVHKHYSAFRKLVDFRDGFLVVNAARVGLFFFANRHEENAKSHRNAFLKYMHKIDMAQQERRKLLEAQIEAAQQEKPEKALNYFAPTKNLKMLLQEEWFSVLTTNEKKFNAQWSVDFADALMASEWRDHIATEWDTKERRLLLKCMIIGVLKDSGVLRGSYNAIAKLLDMDDENPATLAKYMGMGKKQGFADWIDTYVKSE